MSTVETLQRLINITLFTAGLRMATSIIFATLGGIFCSECGVLNVGLEGLMLIGAFFAIVGSYFLASPWAGLLLAVIVCLALSLAFAAVHLEWGANQMIVGLAMNILAYGLTTYLLRQIFNTTGYFSSPKIIPFQLIQIPLVSVIPVLGPLLSGHFALVYLSFVAVVTTWFVLYKTPWGFRFRAVGESPLAAEAVGINLRRMKYIGVLVGGMLCAVGGAFLSLGQLNLFTEDMSAGRGFLALAAVNFGGRKPFRCLVAALVFGLADALSVRLQRFGLPSQLVLMLPYVATVVVLTLSAIQRSRAERLGSTIGV